MIVVSIFGGLGNQMFQYAAAKALALKHGYQLKLDVSLVLNRTKKANFTYRNYELGFFRIEDEIATPQEIRKFVPNLWHSPEYLKQMYKLFRFAQGLHLYREAEYFAYNKAFQTMPDNTYLYGYFQSADYFNHVEPSIRACFNPANELDSTNKQLIERMQAEQSVAVHIRRGDYQNSDFTLLDVDAYYLPAMNFILQKYPKAKFYIFTNDMEWAQKAFVQLNLNIEFVIHNTGNESYKDMLLMRCCKHNIIANSSFSWWGAWLNENENKIVIAPLNWYQSGRHKNKTRNLLPEKWIKM